MAVEESITKTCTRCGEQKPLENFALCRGKPRARCKPCHSLDAMDWVSRNKDRRIEYYKSWYKPHPIERLSEKEKKLRKADYNQKWREANKDRFNKMRRDWLINNPDKVYARTRKYQASKKNAVPAWADIKAMELVYAVAKKTTKETGVKHEVDHVVPLTSSLVCGLHVEYNLKIITQYENRSKANRAWPDMP